MVQLKEIRPELDKNSKIESLKVTNTEPETKSWIDAVISRLRIFI